MQDVSTALGLLCMIVVAGIDSLMIGAAVPITGNALQVARMPGVLKQWEGVAQIISRRMDMERKYLHRLEGEPSSQNSDAQQMKTYQTNPCMLACPCLILIDCNAGQKGSDVSAKEATRKLLAATKQLDSLSGLITQVTTEAEAHGIEVRIQQQRHIPGDLPA
jgi:hypothetical protein